MDSQETNMVVQLPQVDRSLALSRKPAFLERFRVLQQGVAPSTLSENPVPEYCVELLRRLEAVSPFYK